MVQQDALPSQALTVRCCIAGGGPAGMMLGFLLARAGLSVVVLEKHADFLRDFRGDTIHPSTLEVMYELGLLERFLKRPHQEVRELAGQIGDIRVTIADFSHLPTRCHFIALMPQWDFLDFLASEAACYPSFMLKMETEAVDLVVEGGKVIGVKAVTPDGPLEIRADLTIAADGRHSTLRQRAGLPVKDLGAPIDVLWMRLSRRPNDKPQSLGRFEAGRVFIMIDRGDYWQCAFVIPKGSFDRRREEGLVALRQAVAELAPAFADRLDELRDWDDVKLLTVAVNRLQSWHRPGFLCIGDAAHAMSPVGGVGVNLAIQDAVAAANILAPPLLTRTVGDAHLRKLQHRRTLPTVLTQAMQLFIQNRIISPLLARRQVTTLPLPLRLLRRWPWLRRLPARIIGMGFRPEHVRTPQIGAARS